MRPPVDVLVAAQSVTGEGPFWQEQESTLHWTDLPSGVWYRSHVPTGRTEKALIGGVLGAVVPDVDGSFVAITERGFEALEGDRRTVLSSVTPGDNERMNDGKCDSKGRFWAGSATYDFQPGQGRLHVWHPADGLRTVDTGLTLPNGIGWSPDEQDLYLVDSLTRTLYRYEFDCRTGEVSRKQVLRVFEPEHGLPDGLAVDDEGCLWIAFYGGSALRRISPGGQEIDAIQMPVTQPTSCCFIAPGVLAVTTSRSTLTREQLEEQPWAGSVLRVSVTANPGPVHRCAALGSDRGRA